MSTAPTVSASYLIFTIQEGLGFDRNYYFDMLIGDLIQSSDYLMTCATSWATESLKSALSQLISVSKTLFNISIFSLKLESVIL